jgi:hypothetical protein
VLGPSGFGSPNHLGIFFSQSITSISLSFVLADISNSTSMLLSNGFGGTASAMGTIPAGLSFPEGSISFSGAPFPLVVLTSAASQFVIDNIIVTTAPVAWPHRGRWTSGPDLGERWLSRLVATAAAERLSNSLIQLRRQLRRKAHLQSPSSRGRFCYRHLSADLAQWRAQSSPAQCVQRP